MTKTKNVIPAKAGISGQLHKIPVFTGMTTLILLILLSLLPTPMPPAVALDQIRAAPSWAHPFGTDTLGRDYAHMLLIGTFCSLQLSVLSALCACAISCFVGISAGLIQGHYQTMWMRLIEILISLPYLPLAILWQGLAHQHHLTLVLFFICLSWPHLARQLNTQTQFLKTHFYIKASASLGGSWIHLMRTHILPATTPLLTSGFTLIFTRILMFESMLSFLGLGQQFPRLSLGGLIHQSQEMLFIAPYYVILPGLILMGLVMLSRLIQSYIQIQD